MESLIYTDGSCIQDTGNGGWCFLLFEDETKWLVYGNSTKTTNNRMELMAVIKGLEFSKYKNIKIYTDSLLTINCSENKWKRKTNVDLWFDYDRISKGKNIEFIKVKAHSGDKYNSVVDKQSRAAARREI